MKRKLLHCGIAHGVRGADGRFDQDDAGPPWMMFEELFDIVFWNPVTGETATWDGLSFALGEEAIDSAGTYAFDGKLHIHASVGRWMLADGAGIFVLDWSQSYERLRFCPRIGLDKAIEPVFDANFRAPVGPALFVKSEKKKLAHA